MKRFILALVMVLTTYNVYAQIPSDLNPACPDQDVFTNMMDQVCWDCFLDDFTLFGVGGQPDGASSSLNLPVCACTDALGIPEFGYPVGFWSPQKVAEVVTQPWCSPSLGGIRLQDSLSGMGMNRTDEVGMGNVPTSFFHYHYFAYPIMSMIGMMSLPSCMGLYVDFDLLYISEIDPMWDSILNLLLNPEAIIFSTPAAYAWCSADCILTTADNQLEEFYGCAACDGSLYPLMGRVMASQDPVAASSLITQRILAGLHRKGLAQRTIGDEAMCEPEYWPTIPRSQYKFSMIAPVPETSSSPTRQVFAPFIGDPSDSEDVKQNDPDNNAGRAGAPVDMYDNCCHPMGMSTSRWCLPVGGRTRPGKDSAYSYLIWNYRNCCVRATKS